MGLAPRCYYTPKTVGEQAQSLAGVVQDFFTSGWEPLVRGGIDGYNISESLIDKRCGLEWHYAAAGEQPHGKRLCVPALSDTQVPAMRRKGQSGSNRKYGLELVVDPANSTYGKVCVVASTDLTKQIISFVPQDPKTATNPTGSVLANYGKGIFGTSGAFNWELHRNGTASLTDDGTNINVGRGALAGTDSLVVRPLNSNSTKNLTLIGSSAVSGDNDGGTVIVQAGIRSGAGIYGQVFIRSGDGAEKITIDQTGAVTEAGDHTFTDTLTSIADTLLGNERRNQASPTVTKGGTYSVAATIRTVFLDASPLTGALDNFTVELPSAVTFVGRVINIKVTVIAGGAGATITVTASAGSVVDGTPADATGPSKVTFQSNGANWYSA